MFLRFEVVIIEEAVSPSGLIATSNCISKAPVAYSGSLIYGKGSGFGEVCSGPEIMDVEAMRIKVIRKRIKFDVMKLETNDYKMVGFLLSLS